MSSTLSKKNIPACTLKICLESWDTVLRPTFDSFLYWLKRLKGGFVNRYKQHAIMIWSAKGGHRQRFISIAYGIKSIVECFCVVAQDTYCYCYCYWYCCYSFLKFCLQWLKSPRINFGVAGHIASGPCVTSPISWLAGEALARGWM